MDDKLTQKLTNIIYQALGDEPERVNFHLLVDVKSFWSQTARVIIHWSSDKDPHAADSHGRLKYPPKLFIKLPSISTKVTDIEHEHELEGDLRILWNTEVQFYDVFGRTNLGLFKIPKVYLTERRSSLDTGYFVLEDMSATDGHIFSEEYIPGFSLDQVKKIARGLADLHYHNITSSDKSWMTRCDVPIDAIDNFCSLMWTVASKMKTYGLDNKIDQIESNFTKEFTFEGRHGYKKHGLPPVMIHQDLNATNILWTKINGAKEISAFIDFQLSTVGGICEDIIRVLALGMSTDDRRKYTDCVLQTYHDRITEVFKGDPPFSLKQVEEEYRRAFAHSNNFTLFGISCYYGLCKEEKLPADVKHQVLSEYLNRASGIIEDILAFSH